MGRDGAMGDATAARTLVSIHAVARALRFNPRARMGRDNN